MVGENKSFDLRLRKGFQGKLCVPLVSIITVVFNGASHIRQTILSVLQQSYKNIEYIIIDGGSTDGTLEIIKEFDSLIDYWKSEPDSGISDAFNKGISFSKGDLIGIINADDWYNPDAVEKIVEAHLLHPRDIIHGNIQFWTDQSRMIYVFYGNDSFLPYRSSINHPTVFVPRIIYNKIGLYSLKYKMAMDFEWLGRAKQNGINFYYLNTIIANMRRGGISDQKLFRSYWEGAKARNDLKVPLLLNSWLFVKSIF